MRVVHGSPGARNRVVVRATIRRGTVHTPRPTLHSPRAPDRHRHPLRHAAARGRLGARARRGRRRRALRREVPGRRARPRRRSWRSSSPASSRRHLGLPVPDLVLVELDGALAKAEPDGEIQDLLERSAGTNFGLDFLPGALAFAPAAGRAPDADLAAAIVWFDAFTTNVDRTARNPNLIVWHRRPYLIDHGSALYVHHTWTEPAAHARRPFPPGPRPRAAAVRELDRRRRRAPRAAAGPRVLEGFVAAIPDDWLQPEAGLPDPDAHRAAYVDYLLAGSRHRARSWRRPTVPEPPDPPGGEPAPRSSTRSSGSCRASSAARRSTPGSS